MFTYSFYCVLDLANGRTHKAGLFSAALTAFIIDRTQTIQPTPAQQSAHFQKQSALLLNQISQQLSSLGAHVSTPSNISLSDPTVSPIASDVRVNICWFMSLVSSLSAALLATFIQRWAREYMYMFQRYSNPFEIARIRQYLHEGAKSWGLPKMVEGVPALIHISLFLFFIGLADFLLTAYAIVGKITLLPIILCVTFYIITTVLPIIDPQTPYRTSFSGMVWSLTRWLRSRPCRDRFGKPSKPLSLNMAKGQMQLAMERNDARRDRDERAIGWLAENLRGNAEMESFTQGIPGSFNTKWGRDVWNKHRGHSSSPKPANEIVPGATAAQNDDQLRNAHHPRLGQNQAIPWGTKALRILRWPLIRTRVDSGTLYNVPTGDTARQMTRTVSPFHFATSGSPSPQERPDVPQIHPAHLDVDELCKRILHLFETYDNRDHFLDVDEWRKRSRACVETAASFVFCMNVDFHSFGEIGKLLSDLGDAENTNNWSETSLNRSFLMRWTCLSLVATRRMLDTKRVRQCAGVNISLLALYNAVEDNSSDTDDLALSNAQKIDTKFKTAWNCVDELYSARIHLKDPKEMVSEVKTLLNKLEDIQVDAHGMGLIDMGILTLQSEIDRVTYRLTRRLPGVSFDTLTDPHHLADIFDFISNPIGPQLLYLRQRLQGLHALNQEQDIQKVVSKIREKTTAFPRVVVSPYGLMERQLWRLQDLSVGGAFGFTLELYFLALRQLLPASSSTSREFTAFYIGALKNIISDWSKYKDSPGTQKIILNLICDIGVRDRGIFSNYPYPNDITNVLVRLLCKMIQGRKSDYIKDAMEELRDVGFRPGNDDFRKYAYRAIAKSLAAPQPSH